MKANEHNYIHLPTNLIISHFSFLLVKVHQQQQRVAKLKTQVKKKKLFLIK